jgi:hypothetical protein
MKCGNLRLLHRLKAVAVIVIMMSLCYLAQPALGSAQVAGAPVGPGTTLVHSQFGGQIFGFDIDQNGAEGVLSEAQLLSNGNVLAAVETFDQKSGKILKVVSKLETQDDFVTMGIAGTSVGLIEPSGFMKS